MDFPAKVLYLATAFNLSITSWIRSRKRNDAVGGVSDSRHLVGLAVDVVLDAGESREGFLRECKALGLQVIDEKDHLHVQEPRR